MDDAPKVDVVLRGLTEDQLDILSMSVDLALGNISIDFTNNANAHSLPQLRRVKEAILEYRASIMSDEEVREMSLSADKHADHYVKEKIFSQSLREDCIDTNTSIH